MSPAKISFVLFLFCIIAATISLLIGPANIGIADALKGLMGEKGAVLFTIMREIRLPRVILSLIIGFALAISGAAMQGFLRNPLAEPGVLGVSTAAALGAVIALQTGFAVEGTKLANNLQSGHWSALWLLPISAMVGAILCAILLLFFGRNARAERLILIGIGVSAISGALTSLVLNLSPNPFAASEIMFWMMGSVADRSIYHVWMVAPFLIIGSMALIYLGKSFDALALGEDTAQSMGISLRQTAWVLILAVSAMVGASVAVAGAIGFVGLVVPHMLRPFVGSKPSNLLFVSGLGGAFLLTLADILTRVIAPERDIKLGVITALIGAPVFLHIVISSSKRGAI